MSESRGQFEARLQAEGRWLEFNERVDYLRQRFLQDGVVKKEVGSRAYRQALEEYAPPEQEGSADAGDVTSLIDPGQFEGKRGTEVQAIRWVAQNMDIEIGVEDAPGSFAWSLLAWVRKAAANKTTFMTTIMPKVLPAKPSEETDSDQQDQACLDLIDQVRAASAEAKLAAMRSNTALMEQLRGEIRAELSAT